MTRYASLSNLMILIGICAAAFSGCKKDKKGGGTTATEESSGQSTPAADETNYQEYAPLPKVLSAGALPILVDQNGIVEVPCFKKQEKVNSETASMDIKAILEKDDKYIKQVVGRWLLEDIAPSGVTEDDLAKWNFGVEYPLMMEMDPTALRFADDQECVQETTGWLDNGVHAATTLIGARNFTIESTQRLTIDQQDSIKEALKDKGFTMEGDGLDLYRPLLDDEGNPKTNADKLPMFSGPGGISISEKDLPPESERGVKEWSFKSENPLFFAFRELPNDAWQKLQKKKECYVFVVWGDVKPRAPECAEFTSATFSAEKIDDQNVKVEVTVDKDSKKLEMPFETTQKIVMGDRVMLWINVKKEEEGATIRFNSLVIGELFKK
jgi:hypothetical protein